MANRVLCNRSTALSGAVALLAIAGRNAPAGSSHRNRRPEQFDSLSSESLNDSAFFLTLTHPAAGRPFKASSVAEPY